MTKKIAQFFAVYHSFILSIYVSPLISVTFTKKYEKKNAKITITTTMTTTKKIKFGSVPCHESFVHITCLHYSSSLSLIKIKRKR